MIYLKSILKKILLKRVSLSKEVRNMYAKLGFEALSDRTLYYGTRHLLVRSLATGAAPGTAETVLKLLSQIDSFSLILDYGCGLQQSKHMVKMGYNVHSCDILDFHIPNFTKIDPSKKKLPFTDKQFDITVASEVLEHVESPFELLLELIRVTKKSIIITTPNTISLKSRKMFGRTGYFYWFFPKNHNIHISPIFPWQIKIFCKNHGVHLKNMIGNHKILGLGGNALDYAEILIYKIEI
jgi:2-polyprenyl-3-methyl-5-hydroxy-6-metoxy-1,4-benzoquinol methylase